MWHQEISQWHHDHEVQDVGELVRHPRRRPRTKGLIGQLDEGRLVRGRLQHPVQLRLLAFLCWCLQSSGPALQLFSEGDGLFGEVRIHGGTGFRGWLAGASHAGVVPRPV